VKAILKPSPRLLRLLPGTFRRRLRRRALVAVWVAPFLFAAGLPVFPAGLPEPPAEVRIMSYNVYNYFDPDMVPQLKSPESRQAVIDTIIVLKPDIAILVEMGAGRAVEGLLQALKARGSTYPFHSVVSGADPVRHLVVLARFRPVGIEHRTDLTYRLKGQSVPVQRGIAHCVFRWNNGYTLHLLAAHLKSKLFHPLGQTDMRRYEARQLRYLVDAILKKEPTANVLVVGDMNDTPDSSPIKTLYNRRRKPEARLYDLRPVDRYNMAWTHCYDPGDTYTRIDYALASFGLLPEVDLARTIIPFIPDWYVASDHRPLIVVIRPRETPATDATLARFDRCVRRPDAPMSFFHGGRVVGTRKARKSR